VFGAGCQLALGADIRIAGPDTKIAVMELKWGIVPDMGGMVLLPKLVAPDVMRKLTYTATPVGADQALAWGLVTKLADDPLAAAMELAAEIAGRSPAAIRAAKRLMVLAETATDADILLADDGFDSDVEIVSAQLCGVDVQGGHLAVEQAMNLCRAFRTALDPNYR